MMSSRDYKVGVAISTGLLRLPMLHRDPRNDIISVCAADKHHGGIDSSTNLSDTWYTIT